MSNIAVNKLWSRLAVIALMAMIRHGQEGVWRKPPVDENFSEPPRQETPCPQIRDLTFHK